jgi:translation initiation factor IF-2
MKETGTTRLNKAAREFNVGKETIVEFLHKKGYEIDSNPNTKLTAEMYNLLTKEYMAEKSVKEESRKKGLASFKRESISIDDRKKQDTETDYEDEEDDIIIRGVSVEIDEKFKKSIEPMSVRRKEQKDIDEVIEELSVDKVEEGDEKPDRIFKAKEKTDETADKTADKQEEQHVEPPVTSEPTVEEVKKAEEAPKAVEPKQEQTPDKKPETKKETVPEVPEKEPEQKPEPEPEKKAKPEAEPDVPEEKQPEQPETPAEQEPSKLKIIGKIDLKSINEKTKPAKKSPEERRKEREQKRKPERKKPAEQGQRKPEDKKTEKPAETKKSEPLAGTEQPKTPLKPLEHPDSSVFKLKIEKLQGPNILGKIELPEKARIEKKKPVASSSDSKVKPKKKKRRRIKTEEPKPQPPAQQKTDDKAKPKPRLQRHKRFKKDERPELTQEDIQKQIKETMARLSGAGKSKSSKHRRQKRDLIHKQKERELQDQEEEQKTIKVAEYVTANELATMMNVGVTEIISLCMQLGLVVSINQRLDAETINIVAEEFGYQVEFASVESAISEGDQEEDKPEDLQPRAPIVTVMGHVDHGKTKLLDYIRRTNVIAGEAGGITQHIGAYEVTLENEKKITMLDTPGHEAFTAMRARGAKVTDIAIIVIAADDNVMPQTKEAINHALAADVPIVFAINKIDKPTANPEKIKEQLSQMNILVEEWGGKYQSQDISAISGLNVELLLEKVLLEAELLDLKANPGRLAYGTVIESSLDKGRGYVAKLLVQYGTLKVGDVVLAGSHSGRVRAMYNERNQPIKEAGPSAPLLMLGMNGAPQAGDIFRAMKDEREARNIATKRMQLQREQGLRTQKHITLDEIGRRIAIGDFKELNIIVKGDVDGSVEALSDSLLKLTNEEVQVNVIHKSVGQVTETDVMLASASNAIIIAFQVRPSASARRLAEREQIDIRLYSIIYTAIEEIQAAIEGMLSPDIEEKITSNLEVRNVFKIAKVGTIAGCMVLEGTITRNTRVRLIRDGIVIYTGKLGSLKRLKDDVKEVSSGYECGVNIENFNDIKVGDIIEGFEEKIVARKLEK